MPLLPSLSHGTCWAHIINLVGSKWIDTFGEVNQFVSDMKSIFVHAPARKRRYHKFLSRKGRQAKLAPEPVLTRWNSWFEAVAYYRDYFDVYSEYISEEVGEGTLQGSQAMGRVASAFEEPRAAKLYACIWFITDSTKCVVTPLDRLQGRKYFAVSIYNLMTDLHASLIAGKTSNFHNILIRLRQGQLRQSCRTNLLMPILKVASS